MPLLAPVRWSQPRRSVRGGSGVFHRPSVSRVHVRCSSVTGSFASMAEERSPVYGETAFCVSIHQCLKPEFFRFGGVTTAAVNVDLHRLFGSKF